jgi:hypothetical protein
MNSIHLSLGKNTAKLQWGKVEGDSKTYLSFAAVGPCNMLVYGPIDEPKKQKRHLSEDEEPLLLTVPAKGFTAYWAVENHDGLEIVRVTVDLKTNGLTLDMVDGESGWTAVGSANLNVFPNPEYKFYNYRSEVAAKPLNAPKRPRGRPRKPIADSETA